MVTSMMSKYSNVYFLTNKDGVLPGQSTFIGTRKLTLLQVLLSNLQIIFMAGQWSHCYFFPHKRKGGEKKTLFFWEGEGLAVEPAYNPALATPAFRVRMLVQSLTGAASYSAVLRGSRGALRRVGPCHQCGKCSCSSRLLVWPFGLSSFQLEWTFGE